MAVAAAAAVAGERPEGQGALNSAIKRKIYRGTEANGVVERRTAETEGPRSMPEPKRRQ